MNKWQFGIAPYVILFLLAVPSLAAGEPSMNELFKPDDVSWVGISPDGRHLAMTRSDGATETLTLVKRPIDARSIVNGAESARGQKFGRVTWVNDSYVLIEASHANNNELTGDIYLLGVDGARRQLVKGNKTTAQLHSALVSVLTDDPDAVLLAIPPTCTTCVDDRPRERALVQVSLVGGEQSLFAKSPPLPAYFVADPTGTEVFATGRSADGEVEVYRWQDNQWTLAQAFDPITQSGVVPYFVDASETIFGLANHLGTADLVRWQPQSNKIERFYREPGSDIDEDIRSFGGKRLLAVRTNPGFSQWHYIAGEKDSENSFKSTHKALRAAFPDSDVAVTSITEDLSEAIVRVHSARNAGDYYVVNLSTRQNKLLARSRPWLTPDDMHSSEPVELAARDGVMLRGTLTLPRPEGPHPLVVWLHDQPTQSVLSGDFDSHVQWLALNGYAVLQISYRGSHGFGSQYLIPANDPDGQTVQRDIADATQWAINQGIAQSERVCILGEGYGGFAAVKALTVSSTLFQCGVGINGFYDLDAPFEWGHTKALTAQSVLYPQPSFDLSDAKRSPMNRAVNISAAVLLVGSSDQARTMDEKLRTVGVSVELLEGRSDATRFSELLSFLDEQLQNEAEPAREAPSFGKSLTPGQAVAYQAIVEKMRTEIGKISKLRLPTQAAFKTRARRIINSHDEDVREVVSEEQWQLYQDAKVELEAQLLTEIDLIRIRPGPG